MSESGIWSLENTQTTTTFYKGNASSPVVIQVWKLSLSGGGELFRLVSRYEDGQTIETVSADQSVATTAVGDEIVSSVAGSHAAAFGGKHTTTLDILTPYTNVVSVPGVLTTDLVIPFIESIAATGSPAQSSLHGSFTYAGVEMVVYYSGAAGNNKNVGLTINAVDAGQTPSLLIDVVQVSTAIGITVTPKAADLTWGLLAEALNGKVDGTYSTKVVDFTGNTIHANYYFRAEDGSVALTEFQNAVDLTGGSDTIQEVNLQSATPSANAITFKFKERITAGHVISYLVFRANA